MEGTLWFALSGQRGGANRARILLALREQAQNANELATRLELDYSTVRHHLELLLDQHVVRLDSEGYGAQYRPADEVEDHWETVDQILAVEG
jgi:DNA-binding transcriptional ArsR family regulator